MLSEDTEFLLAEIRHQSQSSWDWPADARFAEFIKADPEIISLIHSALDSSAPAPLQKQASRLWQNITKRRLRGLRELVKRGDVRSNWIGLGDYAMSSFGVNRCRSYIATPAGREAINE